MELVQYTSSIFSIKYYILLKVLYIHFKLNSESINIYFVYLVWRFLFLFLRAKEKEIFTKKKKTRRFSTSSLRSAVKECSAMPNLFCLANLHFVLQTMLGNKSLPTKWGNRKFRAYCSEQSMLVYTIFNTS